MGAKRKGSKRSAGSAESRAKVPVLLAVDDRPENLDVIKALVEEGLPEARLLTAKSGEECLALAAKELPDGFLIDYQMPGMNGLVLCRKLKKDKKTAHIPILLITAHDAASKLRAEGMEAGADDFINKPIDRVALIAKIKVMLRIKRGEDALRQANKELAGVLAERTRGWNEVLSQLDEAVIIQDLDFNILGVNSATERLLGKSFEKSVGGKCYEYLHGTKEPMVECVGCRCLRMGKTCKIEIFEPHLKRYLEFQASPRRDSNGKIIGVVQIVRDIAERKNVEAALMAEKNKLSSIVEESVIGIAIYEEDGQCILANEALAGNIGTGKEKARAQNFHRVDSWKRSGLLGAAEKALSSNSKRRFELRVETTFGKMVWLEIDLIPIMISGKKHLLIMSSDVAASREMGAALQGKTHALGQRVKELSCLYDIIRLSAESLSMDDILRKMVSRIPAAARCPEIACARVRLENAEFTSPRFKESPQKLSAEGKTDGAHRVVVEVFYAREDERSSLGEEPFLPDERKLLESLAENISRFVARRLSGERIEGLESAQKRLTLALAEVTKLSRALEQSADNVVITDKEGVIQFVNRAFETTTGYSKEEALGQTPRMLKSGKHDDAFYKDIWDTLLSGRSYRKVIANKKKNGELYFDDKVISPVKDDAGEITHFVAVGHDITKSMEMEKEMAALAAFPSQNPSPVLRVSENGVVDYCNEASAPLLEVWGIECQGGILPPEQRAHVEETLKTGTVKNAELKCGDRTFLLQYAPVAEHGYAYIYGIDITEQKQMESMTLQAGKMAAVGQLAAGVAHEIRNPLTAVVMNTALLLENKEAKFGEKTMKKLSRILTEADRASEIVKSLLAFSRPSSHGRSRTRLNDVINDSLTLRRHELTVSGVKVVFEFDPDLPVVSANAGELSQVFLNLINNAADAMPKGGRLTMRTYSDKVATGGRRAGDRLKPGQAVVCAAFEDTGGGMSQKELRSLFTPFFTTKEPGKGVGLGLSVSHSIVENHGGEIEVSSEKGKGATFIVKLPQGE